MKYGRHIGVSILLLFTIFTTSAQNEGKEDAVPYKELKKHIPAECRGLHKVKDIDDLLLQIYNNIDNQCMFNIATDKLEKILNILIIISVCGENNKRKGCNNINSIDKIDTLYLIKIYGCNNCIYFEINYTKKYEISHDGFGSSISLGIFPKNLPMPLVKESAIYPQLIGGIPSYVTTEFLKRKDVFFAYGDYIWTSNLCKKDRTAIIISSISFAIKKGSIKIYRNSDKCKIFCY